MMYHLTIQLSNHGTLKVEITHEERAGRYVKDGAGESFVERSVAVTEAGEAGAGAQGGGEGGAEGEKRVFGRMMVIDCDGKTLARYETLMDHPLSR